MLQKNEGLKPLKQRQYKTFVLWGVISTIAGLILICMGIFVYVFREPQAGINLSTLQPVVIDGTIRIFLGFALVLIGSYRLIFKKKAFEKIEKSDHQQKMNEYSTYLKNAGYGQKEIKKRRKILRKKI